MLLPTTQNSHLSGPSRRSIIRWTTFSLAIVGLFHPAIRFHLNPYGRDQVDTPMLPFEDQGLTSMPFNKAVPILQRDNQDNSEKLVNLESSTAGKVATKNGCPIIRREGHYLEHGCVAEGEKLDDTDGLNDLPTDNDDSHIIIRQTSPAEAGKLEDTYGLNNLPTDNDDSHIIVRQTSPATSPLRPMGGIKIEQASPSHILTARWAAWFNPRKCRLPDGEESESCKAKEQFRVIGWSALAVVGVCTLMLLLLRGLDCIRRRGAVSHDLSMIMAEQGRTTAPRIRSLMPLKLVLGVDGEVQPAEDDRNELNDRTGLNHRALENHRDSENHRNSENRNELNNKRVRPRSSGSRQMDEEADVGTHECKSLDGTAGWTSWFANKRHQATFTRKPTPRTRLPRIPSLTLPKPSLATVRKASGLDFYEDIEDAEKYGLNYSRPGTVIRWAR